MTAQFLELVQVRRPARSGRKQQLKNKILLRIIYIG